MGQLSINEIIKAEYIKCANDPVHFFKKYCYISHPQRGKILFSLYPFQEKALKLIDNNPYSIILKSRTVRYINPICRLCFMVDDVSRE